MKPRRDLVEIFSTFLSLEADRVTGWITSPGLKRSMMARLQEQAQTGSEEFWARHWHRLWQQAHPLAEAHLAAHLQETCYWVARKMALGFADRTEIADCFLVAIAALPKLLKYFDATRSQTLKGYAELVFKNCLKDWLRVQRKVEICTDWSLLYRVSQKRLREALTATGLSERTVKQYILAWRCFRELVPVDRSAIATLKCPDAETWKAITAAYHANRLDTVDATAPTSNPEQLEQWLRDCARSVRAFLKPTVISADAPKGDERSANWLDSIPDEPGNAPLDHLLNQEADADRQHQLAQLTQMLAIALADLDAKELALLHAYYRQEQTQTEIARQLDMTQVQVSRQLSRIRRSLLKQVARWSQETLHISPTPSVVDTMSQILEEWLSQTMKVKGETPI